MIIFECGVTRPDSSELAMRAGMPFETWRDFSKPGANVALKL